MYAKGTPNAIKRHAKWLWLGIVTGVLITPLASVTVANIGWSISVIQAIVLAMSIMIAGFGTTIYLNARDFARARRLRGQVCIECLYDLSALPAKGNCPECGVAYSKAEVVRRWHNIENSEKAKQLYAINERESRD